MKVLLVSSVLLLLILFGLFIWERKEKGKFEEEVKRKSKNFRDFLKEKEFNVDDLFVNFDEKTLEIYFSKFLKEKGIVCEFIAYVRPRRDLIDVCINGLTNSNFCRECMEELTKDFGGSEFTLKLVINNKGR